MLIRQLVYLKNVNKNKKHKTKRFHLKSELKNINQAKNYNVLMLVEGAY